MKSLANILAFGALCALKGVAAAPAPYVDDPPVTVTITHTVTVVYPVTATTWVQPTDTSTVSTEGEKKGSTSTRTDTYRSTTTSSTTSTDTTTTTSETQSTETTTPYPTTSTTTTSSTTSTEETTLPPTPTPTPTPTTTTSSTTSTEPPPPVTSDVSPDNSHKSDKSDKPDNGNSLGGGSFSAIGTYYDTGLGSCGITSGPNDMIVAISHTLMDSVGVANPNNNPYCGKKVTCCREGGNPVTVIVVDRCVGCDVNHFDFSWGAYEKIGGTIAEGVIPITCQWDS